MDVYLGLGSNVRPEENLVLAVTELGRRFRVGRVSTVYRNHAHGFEGEDFLNAVAQVQTDVPVAEVCRHLDAIHDLAGRQRGQDAFVARTLDIDLLMYGQQVSERWRIPRDDILMYSFVLRPLAEIAPALVHPVNGKTMARLWAEFDADAHPLIPTDLILLNGNA